MKRNARAGRSPEDAERIFNDLRLDDTVAGLDRLTTIDPKHWTRLCVHEGPFVDTRRLGGVIRILDSSAKESSLSPSALIRRARARRILGDVKGAIRDAEQSLRKEPDAPYALACLSEARRAYEMDKKKNWSRPLERAKSAAPDCVPAYLWHIPWDIEDEEFDATDRAFEHLRRLKFDSPVIPILSGILEISRQRLEPAKEHFKRAIERAPKCPGAWIMLAKTYRLEGDDAAMEEALEQAGHLDPDFKVTYYSILGMVECLDDPARGYELLSRAIKKNPRQAWAYALRGEVLRMPALSRFAEAVQDLEKAVALRPDKAWLHAFLGRALATAGEGARGLEAIHHAIALAPDCAWLYAWRGEALRKAGRNEEALGDFDRSAGLGMYSFNFAWRGALHRVQGGWHNAISDLDLAADLDPWYEHIYAERAKTLLKLGDFQGAMQDMTRAASMDTKYAWISQENGGPEDPEPASVIAELTQAAEKDPESPWVHAWLGESKMKLRQYAEALKHLDQAIQLDTKLACAYGWRGEAFVRNGESGAALKDLDKAVRLDPRASRSWAWKGAALFQLGRYQEAVRALDASLALDGRTAWALAWRGEAKLKTGEIDAAVRDFDQALNLDRRYVEAYLLRAEAHYAAGRGEAAIADASRSLELRPDQPRAHILRALASQKLGRYLDELLDFARALAIEPKLLDPDATQRLRQQLLKEAEKLLRDGDLSKARQLAEAVLRFDPRCGAAKRLLTAAAGPGKAAGITA